jgi:hypothetical protein
VIHRLGSVIHLLGRTSKSPVRFSESPVRSSADSSQAEHKKTNQVNTRQHNTSYRAHSKARAHEYCTALDESSKKLGLLDDFQMTTTNKACQKKVRAHLKKFTGPSRATTSKGVTRTSSCPLSKFPVRSVQ